MLFNNGDLKRVEWDQQLQDFNSKRSKGNKTENKNPDIKEIKPVLNLFLTKPEDHLKSGQLFRVQHIDLPQ